MGPFDDATRERGRGRLGHVLGHDPHGCWVAELNGRLVGTGLATRRGRYWFLSLLAVQSRLQGRGLGQRLLDAALTTFEHSGGVCASNDPKALRRYRRAGFELRPCYEATGPVARDRLPGAGEVHGLDRVRDGELDRDRELIETVALAQRGAPLGPDLDRAVQAGNRLLVHPDGGYVVVGMDGPGALAAHTEEVAVALLWAALAASPTATPDVAWIGPDQQWAIDVVLAAGLELRPGGTLGRRGPVGPMQPYLPNGALG